MSRKIDRTTEDAEKRRKTMDRDDTNAPEADAKDTAEQAPQPQGADHPEEFTFKDWAQI